MSGIFFGDAAKVHVTGWMLPDEEGLTSPLFGENGEFDASTGIVWRGSPISSTKACYNNGGDPYNEGNSVSVDRDYHTFTFKQNLDCNPLKSQQAPMLNQKMVTTQENIPNTIDEYEDVYQPIYRESGIRRQNIFRPYLRGFNTDGTTKVDDDGYLIIPRFPKEVGPIKYIVFAAT